MEKQFEKWMQIKKDLDQLITQPPYVNEGDIWWISIGENVGLEIGGKSKLFSRPAIILKKLSHKQYLVIPTSTKLKQGSWYVPFQYKEVDMVACLHQVRTIDYRRLRSKLGTLDDLDHQRTKDDFWNLYR